MENKKKEKKNKNKLNEEMWTEECEKILQWSEKASCYRWLHGRSEKAIKDGTTVFLFL